MLTDNTFPNNTFPNNSHILGYAGYSISKYIMVPFKDNGHLSESQINFNKRLSSARMIVERSLGLLKGRSILDTLPMQRTDLIPKYIITYCILHNICILNNDIIETPIIINESHIMQEQLRTADTKRGH